MLKPFCFVITSFGEKEKAEEKFRPRKNVPAQQIDLEYIYRELVKPAILLADLEPVTGEGSGSIHASSYEKIIFSEFCVADLTSMDSRAYYELGMRYAAKPHTTICILANTHFPPPIDMALNRIFRYEVDADFKLSNQEKNVQALAAALIDSKKNRNTGSALYDLVDGISFGNSVGHEKTDIFREQVIYNEAIKNALHDAREITPAVRESIKDARTAAIKKVIEKYGPPENQETGVLIDMMLSYRNVEAFPEMLAFIESMPRYLFETVMVQEQYAFVLNRLGNQGKPPDAVKLAKAEAALEHVEQLGKATSETYSIWGRIYKDKCDYAYQSGNADAARTYLEKACALYREGFESDPRDTYPGTNYVTCLELLGQSENAYRVAPVVEYAVFSKMKRQAADYWDYAALFELSLITNKMSEAEKWVIKTKTVITEAWMPATTKLNLQRILNYRKDRGENTAEIERMLKTFFGA